MTGINLIPARRTEARQRRLWRGRCVVTCAGYVSLVATLIVAARAVLDQGDAGLPALLTTAATEMERTSASLATTRRELDATESLLRSSRAIAEQPDWSGLLGLLAVKAGDQVVLRTVAVRPRETPAAVAAKPAAKVGAKPAPPDPTLVVSLSGSSRSQAAASEFALRLEATGLFNRVTLLDTSRETFAELPLVSFRIECTLAEPTAATAAVDRRGLATGGEP
jgi:hypothetical protein